MMEIAAAFAAAMRSGNDAALGKLLGNGYRATESPPGADTAFAGLKAYRRRRK